MPIIKTATVYFYDSQRIGGLKEYKHICKVNLDTSSGKFSFILPQHIYECFDRHQIASNDDFKKSMELKWNKKSEPIIEFKDITLFDYCIEKINSLYREYRKNELIKKVLVFDSHFTLLFRDTFQADKFTDNFGIETNKNHIQDTSFPPFKDLNRIFTHAIHFGYRVGFQVGRNIYSREDYEGCVSPSPLIATTDVIHKDDSTQKIIDWTQEREDFLKLVKESMDKLIAQLIMFRENITEPHILEMIDKKQIGRDKLLLLN